MMRFISISVALLFSVLPTWGQSLSPRQELHESASRTFLDTHFFENGRGMTLSPDLSIFLKDLKKESLKPSESFLTRRYGFIPGEKRKLVGVFNLKYKGINMAVLGCTGCHSGRAAGINIPGLGNKTIDPFLIGRDTLALQRVWQWFIRKKIKNNPDYGYIHEKSMNFAKVLANKDISNLTRGLVPDSTIKTFFYKDQGQSWGPEIQRTQVKVPSLWGIAEKRVQGIFADGTLNSENYAWAFGAELFASDSGEHLRASMDKLKTTVDDVLAHILPPPYPFEIDSALALRGQKIVEAKCYRCHGNHNRDPEGFPVFEAPQLIPHEDVLTDDQRLNYGDQTWVEYAEAGSVGDLIKFNHEFFNFGYFAPKLWGIWSRFPYLHNGSVPTLYHLLLPQEQRPEVFDMFRAGEADRFDKSLVGLTLFESPKSYKKALRRGKKGDRNIYYTQREEHGNQGHYFSFMKKLSDEDRFAIIEFLKTL